MSGHERTTADMVTHNIDPDGLYSFRDAAALIPSVRQDRISPRTLHRWREMGVFQPEYRQIGAKKHWFVRGRELLRLLQTQPVGPAQGPPVMSPAERDADLRAARAELDRLGIK